MALREIRINPDPVLRKRSKEVIEINSRIEVLIEDMIETMRKADGVGLAAPQIGVLKRIAVIELEEQLYVFINPVVLEQEGEQIDAEACLSVPNEQGFVKRPNRLKAKFLNLKGQETILEAEGFLARAMCHEFDHLDGVLYIDKLTEDPTQEA